MNMKKKAPAKKMTMKRFEGTPMDIAVDKAAIKKMNAPHMRGRGKK